MSLFDSDPIAPSGYGALIPTTGYQPVDWGPLLNRPSWAPGLADAMRNSQISSYFWNSRK